MNNSEMVDKLVWLLQSSDEANQTLALQLLAGQWENFNGLEYVKISKAILKVPLYVLFENMYLNIPFIVEAFNATKDLSITFDYVGLDFLSENIGELENLTWLSVTDNLLRSLPDSICKLKKLKKLSLQGNILESLPENIGELESLEHLALSGNLLTSLPDSICNLKNLKFLTVDDNRLQSLPENIGNLQNCTHFAFNDNQLTNLPKSFGNLHNADRIYLAGNKFAKGSYCPHNLYAFCTFTQKQQKRRLGSNYLKD
jgi:Leucine-rich repeat (LRR) protein